MARSYAPLMTTIWSDEDFVALSPTAQRVYLLAFSQPNITYCGVVAFTAKRWARMSRGTLVEDIEEAITELQVEGFVYLDEDTEELWVRSFVRHNGVLSQPQLTKAMVRSFDDILSPLLRSAFLASLPTDLPQACDSLPAASPRGERSVPEGSAPGSGQDLHPDLNPEPSSSPGPATDDDEVLRELAELRLTARMALDKLGPVGDRKGWLEEAMRRDRDSLNGHVSRARADHPDWDAPTIARFLFDGTEPAKAPTGRMHHCGAGPFVGIDAYTDHLEGCELPDPADPFSDLPLLDDCPPTPEYETRIGEGA